MISLWEHLHGELMNTRARSWTAMPTMRLNVLAEAATDGCRVTAEDSEMTGPQPYGA